MSYQRGRVKKGLRDCSQSQKRRTWVLWLPPLLVNMSPALCFVVASRKMNNSNPSQVALATLLFAIWICLLRNRHYWRNQSESEQFLPSHSGRQRPQAINLIAAEALFHARARHMGAHLNIWPAVAFSPSATRLQKDYALLVLIRLWRHSLAWDLFIGQKRCTLFWCRSSWQKYVK